MKKALIFVAIALVLVCAIGSFLMKGMAANMAKLEPKGSGYTVAKGDIVVNVIDTGTIDAVNSVEVKSRVSGRLMKLLVEEGDVVTQGQVIGIIDPQETEFTVAQNEAQLRGAQSGAAKTGIEIDQRRITARADLQQSVSRLHRLEMELKAQPALTSAAIIEASAELSRASKDRENIMRNEQPNSMLRAQTAQKDADVNYANAKREFDRQESLLNQGFVSGRDKDSARLQMDLAKLKLVQANEELSRIQSQQNLELSKANDAVRSAEASLLRAKTNSIQDLVKREEYRQAVSDVAKARAALQDVPSLQRSKEQNLATVSQLASLLNDSRRQLRETQIKAPISGIVTKKLLKEGELATGLSGFSAGTAIVRIEDRNTLRVKLNMNEIDVAKMTEGMTATITVDAIADQKFEGYVKAISPTSNEVAAGTASGDSVVKFEVEVRLKSIDKRLRSGMSAKCTLEVVRRNGVIVVPKDYVGKDAEGHFVQLAGFATPAGAASGTGTAGTAGAPGSGADTSKPATNPGRRSVKIGAESGAQYEVISGVNVGDKLVQPTFSGPARKGMMMMGGDDQ